MNLLPKRFEEFREKEYWDKFFLKRQSASFEWYGDYTQLRPLLSKFMNKTDGMLVVGCGNSKLSADLYDCGHKDITNVDISDVVINQMRKMNRRKRPAMKWIRADVTTTMQFDDEHFDVLLDKGTLDALMSGNEQSVTSEIDSMFAETERILKSEGGRYVCISLLQEHILKKILDWFLPRRWKVRICHNLTEDPNRKESADLVRFPVFVVVCTRLQSETDSMLECSLHDETVRTTTGEEIIDAIRRLQQFAFSRYELRKGSIKFDDEVSFDLCIGSDNRPRYHIYVSDRPRQVTNKFAVFVVPQGRELEWLFGSQEGRKQLAECASFERLAVVHLDRDHRFQSLDAIKKELSSKVMELAPKGLPKGTAVPFLSVGESVGIRNAVYKGTSDVTGDYVIEDIEGEDGQMFRRLIFLNNPNIVQSEARLIATELQTKKESKKKEAPHGNDASDFAIDRSYLACQFHVSMAAGLTFVNSTENVLELDCRILVIGLGGGGLPTFLRNRFSKTRVDVVELDPTVVELAKSWFGFEVDEKLSVTVADGLSYVEESATNVFDVVMVDVDSKDVTVGMSSPPQSFIERRALETFKSILTDRGVFVLNLVCRNTALRSEVICKIKSVFGQCHSRKTDDEVNEIIYSRKTNTTEMLSRSTMETRLNQFNLSARNNSKTDDEDIVSVQEMLESFSTFL